MATSAPTTTPSTTGISFSSALVTDYRDDMSEHECFRAVVTFPSGTTEVEIWAEETTEIIIREQSYTIDRTHSVQVAPNRLGKVVITIEATDVAVSPLMLRTNAMRKTERYYVFPDADAHRKLSALKANEIYESREALGISSETTKADCRAVTQTLKNLSGTVEATYDAESGGLGRYESVEPRSAAHAHWMVDFTDDEPTYKELTAAQARAASKGAVRVGGELAQGRKRRKRSGVGKSLRKSVKKADKVVVSTTSSAKKTASKTTSSAKKTAKKTTTSAKKTAKKTTASAKKTAKKTTASAKKTAKKTSKRFRHGQLISAADITSDMAKIDGLAKNGAESMAKAIRKGAKKALVVTVTIGGEVLQFVVDTAKHVGAVIAGIVEKLGTTVVKLVKWLADLLDWDDVIRTQRVIKESFNKALDHLGSTTDVAKKELLKLVGSLGRMIDDTIDQGIEKYGAGLPRNDKKGRSLPSAVTDKVDWLMSKIAEAPSGLSGGRGLAKAKAKPFRKLIAELKRKVTSDPELEAALGSAVAQLTAAFEKPNQAPEAILGLALSLLKAASSVALSVVEGLVSIVFDLLEEVLGLLRKIGDKKIRIPFLSKLYKKISKGEPLTLTNFITLVIAVPTTMLCKVLGEKPFAKSGALAQDMTSQEYQQEALNMYFGCMYSGVQYLNGFMYWSNFIPDEPKDPDQWQWDFFNSWLGLVGQLAGFPTGHPSIVGWSWSGDSSRLANSIWLYQWLMLGTDMVKSKLGIEKDDAVIFDVVVEGIHLALFVALIATTKADRDSHSNILLDISCLLDPLPGLMTAVKHSELEDWKTIMGANVAGPIVFWTYGSLYAAAIDQNWKKAKREYRRSSERGA